MQKEEVVLKLLKKNKEGLSITDIVNNSNFSRSTIISTLAKLEGARKVSFRRVGMAKLYTLR